jgi:hypothetical protein
MAPIILTLTVTLLRILPEHFQTLIMNPTVLTEVFVDSLCPTNQTNTNSKLKLDTVLLLPFALIPNLQIPTVN